MKSPELKLERLIAAGASLATIAFNLKQLGGSKIPETDCASMARCQEEWDDALRDYRTPEPLTHDELLAAMNEPGKRARG